MNTHNHLYETVAVPMRVDFLLAMRQNTQHDRALDVIVLLQGHA